MSWRPDRYAALRVLLRGPRVQEDIDAEFEHHLEERIASNIAHGMTPAAAREDALWRFGDVARLRRATAQIDESIIREQKRMEIFDALRRELRQAARGLGRAPGFSLVAVATLALGIGAAAAVFTLLKAVVLDPLPYPEADRLVSISHAVPGIAEDAEWGMSSASYFHFRERAAALEELALYYGAELNVRGAGDASLTDVVMATPALFPMLGARSTAGRLFRPDDGAADALPVALLSHGYWQREFGGSQAAIGSTITVEGNAAEVVGVLREAFALPQRSADVYLAMRMNPAGPHFNSHYLSSVGKLRADASLATLDAELRTLNGQLTEAYPEVYGEGFMRDTKFAPLVRDLRASVVDFDIARTLWVLLGSVAVVLLIAGANVANLFLVRSESRLSELSVRRALGAERGHIFLQSVSEAMLLSLGAGAVGLWLGYGTLRVLIRLAPESLPRLAEVQLGAPTIGAALGLAALAGLVFALFPVLRPTDDYAPLREAGRSVTASRRQLRVRSALVAAQIALALVLLASAGLMLRSFQHMRDVELGFRPEGVLTLQVALPYAAYDEHESVAQFWRAFLTRVERVPGVSSASGAITIPMGGGTPCAILAVTPAAANPKDLGCPAYNVVTPGYFETSGIEVRGRTPAWQDIEAGTGAVVVSAALAELLWPGEDPIGRGVRVPNGEGDYYRIVGVAADVRSRGVREAPPAFVYYPIKPLATAPLWQAQNSLVVMVRTERGNPEQLTASVRAILRSMEPAAALGTVSTWEDLVAESMSATTFTMLLLGTAGGMALLLAVVGLYGVIAYIVSQRRSEIGVRMALGADRGRIGRMVVLQSMALCSVGVVAGLLGAVLTTGMLRSLLFEVAPTDPVTLIGVAALLLAVCAAASFIPAARAARVSPLAALRAN